MQDACLSPLPEPPALSAPFERHLQYLAEHSSIQHFNDLVASPCLHQDALLYLQASKGLPSLSREQFVALRLLLSRLILDPGMIPDGLEDTLRGVMTNATEPWVVRMAARVWATTQKLHYDHDRQFKDPFFSNDVRISVAVISELLSQFAMCNDSERLGIPVLKHLKLKAMFEVEHLPAIYDALLHLPESAESNEALSATLSWRFTSTTSHVSLAEDPDDENDFREFPEQWQGIIQADHIPMLCRSHELLHNLVSMSFRSWDPQHKKPFGENLISAIMREEDVSFLLLRRALLRYPISQFEASWKESVLSHVSRDISDVECLSFWCEVVIQTENCYALNIESLDDLLESLAVLSKEMAIAWINWKFASDIPAYIVSSSTDVMDAWEDAQCFEEEESSLEEIQTVAVLIRLASHDVLPFLRSTLASTLGTERSVVTFWTLKTLGVTLDHDVRPIPDEEDVLVVLRMLDSPSLPAEIVATGLWFLASRKTFSPLIAEELLGVLRNSFARFCREKLVMKEFFGVLQTVAQNQDISCQWAGDSPGYWALVVQCFDVMDQYDRTQCIRSLALVPVKLMKHCGICSGREETFKSASALTTGIIDKIRTDMNRITFGTPVEHVVATASALEGLVLALSAQESWEVVHILDGFLDTTVYLLSFGKPLDSKVLRLYRAFGVAVANVRNPPSPDTINAVGRILSTFAKTIIPATIPPLLSSPMSSEQLDDAVKVVLAFLSSLVESVALSPYLEPTLSSALHDLWPCVQVELPHNPDVAHIYYYITFMVVASEHMRDLGRSLRHTLLLGLEHELALVRGWVYRSLEVLPLGTDGDDREWAGEVLEQLCRHLPTRDPKEISLASRAWWHLWLCATSISSSTSSGTCPVFYTPSNLVRTLAGNAERHAVESWLGDPPEIRNLESDMVERILSGVRTLKLGAVV